MKKLLLILLVLSVLGNVYLARLLYETEQDAELETSIALSYCGLLEAANLAYHNENAILRIRLRMLSVELETVATIKDNFKNEIIKMKGFNHEIKN